MNDRAEPYGSSLRADQAEETRRRIVRSATEQLADAGLGELTIPGVARGARVAVRTVYRYFPTKDALLEAIGHELDRAFGFREIPDAIPKLAPFLREMFEGFSREEVLLRASIESRAGREARASVRSGRVEALERTLEPLIDGLDATERRRAVALVYMCFSAQTWLMFRDYFGMSSSEASDVASTGLAAVLDSLNNARERMS